MKYALNDITLEQLIEKIKEQGLDKEIFKNLFGFNSGYKLCLNMEEQGEIFLTVESQNTSYRHKEYDPEIMTLNCGWDLHDALREDLDYAWDKDSGEWHIKGNKDSNFDYWYRWYSEHTELEDLLRHRFESAKNDLLELELLELERI